MNSTVKKNYLQINGTAMDTKKAVAFGNFSLSLVQTEMINRNYTKPLEWITYLIFVIVDDTFLLWNADNKEKDFITLANRHKRN